MESGFLSWISPSWLKTTRRLGRVRPVGRASCCLHRTRRRRCSGSGGRRALTGGWSCAFLSSCRISSLGGGWSEPVSTCHSSPPGSVPLPGSPSGQGRGPQRRDRTRSEHPLPRGRALCALNSNVPALRRNAKAFCRVVPLSRTCSVSPRGSCYEEKRPGVEHRAPRSTESLGWAGARRSFPLCPVSAEGYGVPAAG